MIATTSLSDVAGNVNLLEVHAGPGYEFGLMASLDMHDVSVISPVAELLAIRRDLVGAQDGHRDLSILPLDAATDALFSLHRRDGAAQIWNGLAICALEPFCSRVWFGDGGTWEVAGTVNDMDAASAVKQGPHSLPFGIAIQIEIGKLDLS